MPPGIVHMFQRTVFIPPGIVCALQRTVFIPPGIVCALQRTVFIPPGIVKCFSENSFPHHLTVLRLWTKSVHQVLCLTK